MSEHLPFLPEKVTSNGDAEDDETWQDIDAAIPPKRVAFAADNWACASGTSRRTRSRSPRFL